MVLCRGKDIFPCKKFVYGFYVIRKLWHGTPARVCSHRADATPIRYCTNYAYNLSMLDETVVTRPPWLNSSLTCLPWQVISVLHGIILQYLTGFAMRSCESIRTPVSHATIFLQSIKTTAGRTSIRTLRYRHLLHLPERPAQIP